MKKPRMPKLSTLAKRWLSMLPIVVAVLVIAILVRTRSGPVVKAESEIGIPLRVIDVPVVDLIPRVQGNGLAEPARIWRAVAQVKGRIVSTAPQLDPGMLVQQGTELARIDPADYELAVARLQAAMAETRARLNELSAEKQHLQRSLEIEKKSLVLAEASLERRRSLLDQRAVAPDEVDRETRNVLQQQQAIQTLENALDLLPTRRKTLEAVLASHTANLEQAKLDLVRTAIVAPFDCRLAEIHIEQGQFVSAGQSLFEAHGTAEVEVEAKLRPEQLRTLLDAGKRTALESGLTMEALRGLFDLEVAIRVRSGEWEAVWPARFDRIREGVDPRTRAINVVAVVDNPYGKVVPGIRPALVRGMYCEMELRAPARPDTVVLPRSAVHGDHVYVLDSDSRLQKKTIEIGFYQEGLAIVASGLAGGETLVVSAPAAAIEGMKIEALPDHALQRTLVEQAEGNGGSK
ncbi:efflux RND transporter periplasmic adaptor subunit [Pontiellaceae bacterium B12219]|nr:efflux RND transporter periplasmic adaptor subunit [Pontiellaceae bacterium B12219]